MTTQLTTPRPPALSAPGRVRRRTLHGAVAIAAAALIATGAYVATTTTGADPAPPTPATGPDVAPSAQVMRELHNSVAGQYGSRSASDAPVKPSTRVKRELRDSVASQYGRAR